MLQMWQSWTYAAIEATDNDSGKLIEGGRHCAQLH